MGNSGAKKTNEMLSKQTQLANQAGNVSGNRSEEEYNYRTGLRDKIGSEYWNLYNNAGTAGGTGGPVYQPRMNEAMDTAREFMKSGGYSPGQIAEERAIYGAVTPSFYEGLKNRMASANAATGGYSGYNSQTAALARDAARQAFQSNLTGESTLQQAIRGNRLKGMEAVGGFDTEFMNREAQARAQARAGAGSVANRQEDYLRALTGLMGGAEDLPYAQLQLSGYGQGMQGVNSRVDETPGWQKAAMALIPSAANAAMGIWGNPVGGAKKPAGVSMPEGSPNYNIDYTSLYH